MKTLNKFTVAATLFSTVCVLVSGGLYLVTATSDKEGSMVRSEKFKKAAMIFGGIALLSIATQMTVNQKLVKIS